MAEVNAGEIAAAWKILYVLEWKCVATSDGGIDASAEKERRLIDLTSDDVVFERDAPVGVRYEGHLFRFDDPDTHVFWTETYDRYVGGWGEIYDIREYRLQRAAG
ncbi:MAG: hypothetical protein IJJ14_08320 [Coriobacteriales bacterium]|nr:hypothetical protein [Coriobacteriales bacterium]